MKHNFTFFCGFEERYTRKARVKRGSNWTTKLIGKFARYAPQQQVGNAGMNRVQALHAFCEVGMFSLYQLDDQNQETQPKPCYDLDNLIPGF